jgi:hypothetical protein
MKFERGELPLLEPFAVWGILFGLALIGLRILDSVFGVSTDVLRGLFKASVIASAFAGMIFGAYSLREKLKGSLPDRILYVITIAIFLSTIVGVFLLM